MKGLRINTGYTLLELLVVISLAVLILGVVAANVYNGTAGAQMKSQTRQLVALLRQTRVRAMSESLVVGIVTTDEGAGYRIIGDDQPVGLPEGFGIAITVDNLQAGQASNEILFFPDGSSSGGRCRVTSPAGQSEIDVNWLTGEVNLAEPSL